VRRILLRGAAWNPVATGSLGLLVAAWLGTASLAAGSQNVTQSSVLPDGRVMIGTWSQCPEDVERNLELGINLFVGTDCEGLVEALDGRAPFVSALDSPDVPGLVGYHHVDEPDGNGILPEMLPPTLRVEDGGKPVFLTLTAHFAAEQDPPSDLIGKDAYPRYVAQADVVGFDLYPLAHFACWHPRIGLASIYHEQLDLERLAGEKPTFQWLETNGLEHQCGAQPVAPGDVRVEAWLALAGGAEGISWFTHGWTGGTWRRFDVQEDVAAAIGRTNREIQELAPILLARRLAGIFSARSSPVKIGARSLDGKTYLIAVNASKDTLSWRRTLPGLRNQSVSVLGEARSLRARNGRIADVFTAYQVRIYVWKPRGRAPLVDVPE
jgi:hypothetical protein